MANGYTRQSVFIDGDVILAEHGNLEFDWLVNVFDLTVGHTHDGTAGAGAPVPLLKDTTLAQDFTLSPTGVTGTVIKDEDDMVSDSDIHLASQQSIKAYTDLERTDRVAEVARIDFEIENFANSNHGHINYDQIDHIGFVELRTAAFTMDYGWHYKTTATTQYTVTLPALDAIRVGKIYVLSNSKASTSSIILANPLITIQGAVTVAAGEGIELEVGDTIFMVALTDTTMEVI